MKAQIIAENTYILINLSNFKYFTITLIILMDYVNKNLP